MLQRLFSSRVRVEILSLLLLHPDREFYLREVARMTGEDYKSVSLELKNLEALDIVGSRKAGHLKYFRVNRSLFIFDELKSIFLKIRGAVGMIRDALKSDGHIDFAFIYGSFASGTEGENSDIDLMLIGGITLEDAIRRLAGAEQILSREINTTLFDLGEIRKRLKDGDPFIKAVMSGPKIMLIGDDDGLRRLAE